MRNLVKNFSYFKENDPLTITTVKFKRTDFYTAVSKNYNLTSKPLNLQGFPIVNNLKKCRLLFENRMGKKKPSSCQVLMLQLIKMLRTSASDILNP